MTNTNDLVWRVSRSPSGIEQQTLDVLGFFVTVEPDVNAWLWRTSLGEWSFADSEQDAKEAGVYHLRLSLEELAATDDADFAEESDSARAGLEYLDHLNETTWLDRQVYSRGLKSRGRSRCK